MVFVKKLNIIKKVTEDSILIQKVIRGYLRRKEYLKNIVKIPYTGIYSRGPYDKWEVSVQNCQNTYYEKMVDLNRELWIKEGLSLEIQKLKEKIFEYEYWNETYRGKMKFQRDLFRELYVKEKENREENEDDCNIMHDKWKIVSSENRRLKHQNQTMFQEYKEVVDTFVKCMKEGFWSTMIQLDRLEENDESWIKGLYMKFHKLSDIDQIEEKLENEKEEKGLMQEIIGPGRYVGDED